MWGPLVGPTYWISTFQVIYAHLILVLVKFYFSMSWDHSQINYIRLWDFSCPVWPLDMVSLVSILKGFCLFFPVIFQWDMRYLFLPYFHRSTYCIFIKRTKTTMQGKLQHKAKNKRRNWYKSIIPYTPCLHIKLKMLSHGMESYASTDNRCIW